jgi:nitric oxide reductase NorD protein
VHSFEKVHTLETYKGGSKRIDGDDELAAHRAALDELDLEQMVRSHQRARSLYRADVLLDGGVGDLEDPAELPGAVTYDEWDEGRREWRRDWCRLSTREVPLAPGVDASLRAVRGRLARTTTGLRAVFEQLEASRAWKLRQTSGPDVDLDALVARYGALRAGQCTHSRLYAARRRHTRDTAVLVLLDASLSTDAYVANRRVIDVEKDAVIALGDALDGLFDEVAVAAFCSQTRRDCRFLMAKSFREPWAVGAPRVLSLSPGGFTRIGPALRHGTRLLQECGARKRLLLLVSDGKPSDLDRYEGRYGLADVHRAVLDAQGCGVVMHALAVDPAARAWLPSMFGVGHASVVASPEDLVRVLAGVTSTALRG